MAWQFPLSTNTAINLSTTDSVYIAEGILVGTQSTAITGSGSGHIIENYGTVISAVEGIALYGDTNTIFNAGKIVSKYNDNGASGVGVVGGGNSITNDGEIHSEGYGVFFSSAGSAAITTITNHGIIEGNCGVAPRGDSVSVNKLINDGTITGTEKSYGQYDAQETSSPSSATDTIINKGSMIGIINLAGGDDIYNGRSGLVKGTVFGGDGGDKLYAGHEKNILDGGAGADILSGGKGADKLTGGTEADAFLFNATIESTVASRGRDTIMDFSESDSDTIDLHMIDANTKTPGNQAFHFIAHSAFHHVADELRFAKTNGDTYVYGDTNGDGKSDFAVKLEGLHTLTAGDFTL